MPPVSTDHPRNVSDLYLERMIHVRWHGESTTGLLTVGPIRWLPERDRWACFWSIHKIHPEQAELYGGDPSDALRQTIEFVGNLIRGSIEDGIDVWWLYEGDAAGFA